MNCRETGLRMILLLFGAPIFTCKAPFCIQSRGKRRALTLPRPHSVNKGSSEQADHQVNLRVPLPLMTFISSLTDMPRAPD